MKKFELRAFAVLGLIQIFANSSFANMVSDIRETYIPGVAVKESHDAPKQTTCHCKASQLTLVGADPITGASRTVEILLYETLVQPAIKAGTVVVPPIYGVNFLDRMNARGLCKRGLTTALIVKWENYSESSLSWKIHDRGMIRGVAAIRNVVEFVNHLTSGPVGILGTSQGAIFANVVLAVDPLVQVGSLIAGGAPASEILAASNNKDAVALRKARMEKYKIPTEEEYGRILRRKIKFDGLIAAREAAPKSILMFIATADTTVPTQTQTDLWEAWRRPDHRRIPFNHVKAIIATKLRYHRKLMNFFTGKLSGYLPLDQLDMNDFIGTELSHGRVKNFKSIRTIGPKD